MQEKKNKRLVISLVVLLTAIAVLFFLGDRGGNFVVEKNLYRDIDFKTVDRVMLTSSADTVNLRFQGYRWKVADSIDADRGLIQVLFATLQQVEPKRPVAESLQDSLVLALKNQGVKVSLFSNGEEVKSFLAGGNDAKTEAYFATADGNSAHLVSIPGYRVYASGVFEVPSYGWREKLVFDFNWQNFSRLETQFKNSSGDFVVHFQGKQLAIPSIPQPDTARLNSWLDAVSLLTVDEYVPPGPVTDSLRDTTPLLKMNVYDIANRRYSFAVYTAGDRFYGRIGQGTWAVLNEKRIIPLLRPKDFFIKR